jgi:non-canonical poly(A) RNA polymerase PAPD5/7
MTNLKVDIILNSTTGLDSAVEINDMLIRYPGLRPISLVVKHLLALRTLNEVFTGGLGGYAVVCLVVSFLQMHPKVASGAIDPMQNIGALLLDFFQLYGLNFNLDETGLDVRGKGCYYDKVFIYIYIYIYAYIKYRYLIFAYIYSLALFVEMVEPYFRLKIH